MTNLETLASAKRQAAIDQVLVNARVLVMDRGLDVTMDEIAETCGVARRTLFRYFESRERLVAAALDSGIRRYGDVLPTFDVIAGDWHDWLLDTCRAAHRMQATYGAGYWEMTTRTDLPPEIAAVEADRRARRTKAMRGIARKLWVAAGGSGEPPARVTASVAAHLSARFTAAVIRDAGGDARTAADLADAAITAQLREALAAGAQAQDGVVTPVRSSSPNRA